ncbi:Glycosyltransferase involved in cell wall bisynthesis [Parapedobacter luteus]|uniref:Glycosyltransferase involved in cell wall bisynthesis n=1 Tax=Parapedobacter luteus TaxID=623280 RepID=A0A1T4ZU17_9SPHI|nr:glycosyltransferase family 4 protein [Parapedobacter luteus]SKB26230.1 Glycosyltransferase involved in cell wall bisynthesis [Parapedobacter luteus]
MKLRKAIETISSLWHYRRIRRSLRDMRSPLFFIFPSWQLGGSERIHADIMALVKNSRPICIITTPQRGRGLKDSFAQCADLIYLRRWGTKASFKPKMLQHVAEAINKQADSVVFGSNNLFFYDLLPLLKSHVRVIDLTHSITPKQEWCETYNLPHVHRINRRVILGPKTLEAFRAIYAEHNVPAALLARFTIIPNRASIAVSSQERELDAPLHIIFVGRDSDEKRPELFFRIAKACSERGIDARFTAVGEFGRIRQPYMPYVHFAGEIYETDRLVAYYRQAHIIAITSTFEGFPLVLVEAMSQGVVPICTDVGEIPYYISASLETGYAIDGRQPEDKIIDDFIAKISFLQANPRVWKSYSLHCQKLVDEKFSTERFETAYRNLLLNEKER